MQFSLGLSPDFFNQFTAAMLAAMKAEVKKAAEAAVVAKDADTFYTVKEAADRLKQCPKTVLTRISEGKLGHANLGSMDKPNYLISKADLTAYYYANRQR